MKIKSRKAKWEWIHERQNVINMINLHSLVMKPFLSGALAQGGFQLLTQRGEFVCNIYSDMLSERQIQLIEDGIKVVGKFE